MKLKLIALVIAAVVSEPYAYAQAQAKSQPQAQAEADDAPMMLSRLRERSPTSCGDMAFWNYSSGMCEALAMPGMPMTMAMIHGNGFFVGDLESGTRAQNRFSAPNMVMADLGTTVGDRNYINADLMLTAEKWTFGRQGYPLLLQIGEENQDHEPYLDSQHPHSSPIMGLTFSDTFTIKGKDHVKVFAAPRGESTDGPTAFMHRPSGDVNPDAPLGHHIGQDVGHITSSVIGAELRLGSSNFEASTFYGREPEPSSVDLPMSAPDSWALRLTEQLSNEIHAMVSAAFVKSPEPHDADLDHIWRYSASLYTDFKFENGWTFHDALIYGLVNFYDHAGKLDSYLYEATYANDWMNFWGRVEVLQRTPNELQISADRPDEGRYVGALTLGYTHTLARCEAMSLQLGASVTEDFLPDLYKPAYGGSNPFTAKLFLELSGMKMWMPQ